MALLLFAFGWQCYADSIAQLKNDVFLREMDEKIDFIFLYSEVEHFERLGKKKEAEMLMQQQLGQGWEEEHIRFIQDKVRVMLAQTELIQSIRIILYVLGSVFVLVPKIRTAIIGKEE